MAVVDERLRVIRLQGHRVIDAWVMPTNTNTPTIMIAEVGQIVARLRFQASDFRRWVVL